MSTPLLTDAGQSRSLYVRPTITTFLHHEGERLGRTLRDLDQSTSVHPVHSEREFQLDADGLAGGEYHFTSYAFSQTAQIIAPGLSKLLPDISGALVLPDDRQDLVDGPMTIDLWNKLVDLRFPLFQRHRVIRNEETKTIEGLIGHKHQYLENMALYRYVSETLQNDQPNVKMYAAQLLGRRFAVWYRSDRPMFEVPMGVARWPFYYGYYFTNGEATGVSVRGTLAIFTPKGICLGPYKAFGGRVTHTGRDFFQRLGRMFTTVIDADLPTAVIREGAEALAVQSLGFIADMKQAQRKQQAKKLVYSLSHIGVPQLLAKEVVAEGLAVGVSDSRATPLQNIGRVYAGRTLLDLFVPLLRLARQIDLSRREKIEQAAFEMLVGHFLV